MTAATRPNAVPARRMALPGNQNVVEHGAQVPQLALREEDTHRAHEGGHHRADDQFACHERVLPFQPWRTVQGSRAKFECYM